MIIAEGVGVRHPAAVDKPAIPRLYGTAALEGWRAAAAAAGATPGYGLANLRVEWNRVLGTNLDLAGFANNVLNHQYLLVNYSLANEIGFGFSVAGAPRMFGFEGRCHFGDRVRRVALWGRPTLPARDANR